MAKFQNGADGISGDIEAFVEQTVHELEAGAETENRPAGNSGNADTGEGAVVG